MKSWSINRVGLVLLTLAVFSFETVWSQEKSAEKSAPEKQNEAKQDQAKQDKSAVEAKEAPKADAPKKDPPAATPPASAAVSAPKGPVEEFNQKLNEWKEVLKELRTIRQKHLTAEGDAAKELEQQYDQLIAKGDSLIPQLRAIGMKAYAASKDDRSIERFLIQILADDVSHDRYEEAAELSQSLLDSGCEDKKILHFAGVSTFCTNDFERAEKYLKEAQNAGSLEEQGANFLSVVAEYKEYWVKEQELRKKEADAQGDEQLPRVKISTSKGDLVVELFENEAPGAVGNFISLVEKSFYDGLSFHRVLPGFMAQGGCPKGDGSGGPGYSIYCETEAPNRRNHFRGTLSMAHAGKDTGGSQFFVTFVPTPHLNGRHTAFGRVVEGIDVLGRIQRINPEDKERPDPDKILKIEVVRKRNHEYKPSKVQ